MLIIPTVPFKAQVSGKWSKLALACMVANWSRNQGPGDSARRTHNDSQGTAGTQTAGQSTKKASSIAHSVDRLQILGSIRAGDKYTAGDETTQTAAQVDRCSTGAPMQRVSIY